MILDLNDTIDLLASEPSQRQPAFPFEREIRLYQFQTWIYFPRDSKMLKIAGRLAATKMLERIEKDYLASRAKRRINSRRLEYLLENSVYRALYDAVIARYGGWTRLLRTIPSREL